MAKLKEYNLRIKFHTPIILDLFGTKIMEGGEIRSYNLDLNIHLI